MRGAAVALAAAALAAGCVTRRADPVESSVPPPSDPVEAMADLDLRIECDRASVVVPESLRAEVRSGDRLASVRRLVLATREDPPRVEVGGEDFSVIAEGGVRTVRREGDSIVEEGPFHTLVLRNGRLLRR